MLLTLYEAPFTELYRIYARTDDKKMNHYKGRNSNAQHPHP
jgi:hypothetical protein